MAERRYTCSLYCCLGFLLVCGLTLVICGGINWAHSNEYCYSSDIACFANKSQECVRYHCNTCLLIITNNAALCTDVHTTNKIWTPITILGVILVMLVVVIRCADYGEKKCISSREILSRNSQTLETLQISSVSLPADSETNSTDVEGCHKDQLIGKQHTKASLTIEIPNDNAEVIRISEEDHFSS